MATLTFIENDQRGVSQLGKTNENLLLEIFQTFRIRLNANRITAAPGQMIQHEYFVNCFRHFGWSNFVDALEKVSSNLF